MITLEQKKFEEIQKMTEPFARVLVLGCETCAAMCMAGGRQQAEDLAAAIRTSRKMTNQAAEVESDGVGRQCEPEFMTFLQGAASRYDAVLSLACGAGVQMLAAKFPGTVVLPGCNTTSLAVIEELGVWAERCASCGDCILDRTGGLCPIARCAKSLLNGPCGGSMDGKCEISKQVDCVWQLIIDRLSGLGQLNTLTEILPVKNWKPAGHGGPRKIVREDLKA